MGPSPFFCFAENKHTHTSISTYTTHPPHVHTLHSHLHSGLLVFSTDQPPQVSCLILRDHMGVLYHRLSPILISFVFCLQVTVPVLPEPLRKEYVNYYQGICPDFVPNPTSLKLMIEPYPLGTARPVLLVQKYKQVTITRVYSLRVL